MNAEKLIAKISRAEANLLAAKSQLHKARQEVGAAIKNERKEKRLKQASVSKFLGLSQAGYVFLEHGRAMVTPHQLMQLEKFFGGFKRTVMDEERRTQTTATPTDKI